MESNWHERKCRPKIRCEDDTVNDLKITKVDSWLRFVQNGKIWINVVDEGETFNEMK